MLTSDERPPTIDSFQVDQDVYLAEENSVPRVCTDIVSWAGPSLASEAADKSSGSKRLLRKYHFAERGANLKYTPALEGMLGVALIYLQLLVKYTNQMPHVGELYRQSEIAKPSGSIRLPALFWMLWVRLKFLNTRIWQKTSKIATALSWSANKDILVQTIESSIKTCETCRSSQELIADLADGVETLCVDFGVDPSIASLRNEIKSKFDEISRWGTMKKLCGAILRDLNATRANLKSNRNRKYIPMSTPNGDGRNFSQELDEFNGGAVVSSSRSLFRINDLSRKCRKKTAECNEWRKKYHDKETDISAMERKISKLQQSTVTEKERNIQLHRELKEKQTSVDGMAEQVEKIKQELASLKFAMQNEIASRDLTISKQSKEINRLETRLQEAEKTEQNLRKMLEKERAHGAQIWKSFGDLRDSR